MSTALITGASAGLGREFARQLAQRGANLVLFARRREPMMALADELAGKHEISVEVLQADLSDPEAPGTLFEEIRERGLEVDILINNAGSAGPDLIDDKDWQRSHDYLQLMMVSGDYSYGPTKAYLVALSRALAGSLRDSGVHVTALCPGFTHTDFHASEKLTRMKGNTPGFIWYDADVVVREGLAALDKGRDVYTSGRLYRFLVPLLRMPFSRSILSALGVKL